MQIPGYSWQAGTPFYGISLVGIMIIKVRYRLGGSLIRQALALKRTSDPLDAGTYDPDAPDGERRLATLRKTEVRWVLQEDHPALHDEIGRIVLEHQFRLGVKVPLRFAGGMQLATYREGHHYDWHPDVCDTDPVKRLVSASILLTDDFAGGEFEFKTMDAPKLRKAGDIVLFNSWEVHRVAPVTQGVRNSLVAWFMQA